MFLHNNTTVDGNSEATPVNVSAGPAIPGGDLSTETMKGMLLPIGVPIVVAAGDEGEKGMNEYDYAMGNDGSPMSVMEGNDRKRFFSGGAFITLLPDSQVFP